MSVPLPDQDTDQALQEGSGANLHGVDDVHGIRKLCLMEIRILESRDMRILL